MNVESKFALRVFRSKIDFTCRRIYPFGVDYEMMDEFLHLHQDIWFVWRVVLWRSHPGPSCDSQRSDSGSAADRLRQVAVGTRPGICRVLLRIHPVGPAFVHLYGYKRL